MNIVWFKRDLRIDDHLALHKAAKLGPFIPLYILEPELWQQPDMSCRHYMFLQDCLHELDASLAKLGQRLIVKVGCAVSILQDIHTRHSIKALWSHQETWNHWTYQRDIAVKKWCESQHINWQEPPQHGVIRCLKNRDGWSSRWYRQMKNPIVYPPTTLQAIPEESDPLPTFTELGLSPEPSKTIQRGGRSRGLALLDSFLHTRGEHYTKEMSSPLTAFESCSRLSCHLAFGTLSIREVFLACEKRQEVIKGQPKELKGKWPSALRSFSGRLRWHCHFIQKLEDDPRIEFQNMHPVYDQLRTEHFNMAYFEAWKKGLTGYPMVDACMRALTATGWLNFRMRAMLMSFASYHLWLHWREPALHLARLFTDYEPGVHYSQVQMQSGTTGINAIRIYNPIKQSFDQDPDGIFIRQWVPELQDIDNEWIHTPWLAKKSINGYPMPIVDEKIARKHAADQLYGLRKNHASHKDIAKAIIKKHASRKPSARTIKRKPSSNSDHQGELPL